MGLQIPLLNLCLQMKECEWDCLDLGQCDSGPVSRALVVGSEISQIWIDKLGRKDENVF